MDSVDVEYLAQKLQAVDMNGILVLDTRPFMCYNESHVQGAVNVHLPPIVKRRSGGFVALENIVRSEEERAALVGGKYTFVIAYDQNTVDLCSAEKDSNLYVVMHSLKQQVTATVVHLTGGYAAFQSSYPSLTVTPGLQSVGQLSLALPTVTTNNRKPVEILNHVCIGDSKHAGDRELLTRMAFTAVLNVSTTCDNHFESDFRYMRIPVHDNSEANLISWFPAAIAFIESIRKTGGKVLVHCHAGISRSATICLAYLMSKNNLSLDNAYDHIRQRRSVIDPNLNFMRQLKDFENQLSISRVRRNSITGQDCSPLTPSNGECGMSMHSFSFPVPPKYTPLVSPS